jgi:hypothetical protein
MTYAEALAQNNQVKKATELIEQFVLQHPWNRRWRSRL